MTTREIFEKFVRENHLVGDLSMEGGEYYEPTALVAWECFKSGMAAWLERAADWVECRGEIGYAGDIRAMKGEVK